MPHCGMLIAGGVRHDMLPYLAAAGAPVKTLEDLAAYNLKEPKTRIPYRTRQRWTALSPTPT